MEMRSRPNVKNLRRSGLGCLLSLISVFGCISFALYFYSNRLDVNITAAECQRNLCQLPNCYCGGKNIPGDLPFKEVPQMVLFTFDDYVSELNAGLYAELFKKDRLNPNQCPITATFYVDHESTYYNLVQNLYSAGHEIASHSISHRNGEGFTQREWEEEIVGQREILSFYASIRINDIRGMRAPYLRIGGDEMFKMLNDSNFTYDSSVQIITENDEPPSWPYTLDYKQSHACVNQRCPTKSYPGLWEVPVLLWVDQEGGHCQGFMVDYCGPTTPTVDDVFNYLMKNFEKHFLTNRAPLGLFYHTPWFKQPHHKEGLIKFLDTIVDMPEVWMVTTWQAIQWIQNPTPISNLSKFAPFSCDYNERPNRCSNPNICELQHNSEPWLFKTCQPCPNHYPWVGNTGVKNDRADRVDEL